MRPGFYSPSKLIAPLFIDQRTFFEPANHPSEAVRTIPGFFRLTKDQAVAEIERLQALGIKSFILYPVVDHKQIDIEKNSTAILAKDLFLLTLVRQVKRDFPSLNIILDLCLCHFNIHSQCGIECQGEIGNDSTNTLLSDLALNYAEAGANALMISGMIDGAVAAVRTRLEEKHFHQVVLMVQSAKLDSAFYAPFQRIQSKEVQQGQKSTYQLDPANLRQAQREFALDIDEGADVLVIKPTATSLDMLVGLDHSNRPPIFGYITGGEYSLLRSDDLASLNAHFRNLERVGIDAVISYSSAAYVRLLSS